MSEDLCSSLIKWAEQVAGFSHTTGTKPQHREDQCFLSHLDISHYKVHLHPGMEDHNETKFPAIAEVTEM